MSKHDVLVAEDKCMQGKIEDKIGQNWPQNMGGEYKVG